MGVIIVRVARSEYAAVATLDAVARRAEGPGVMLDLAADFSDHTLRMPARGHQGSAAAELV
jgi:hypothetical protein